MLGLVRVLNVALVGVASTRSLAQEASANSTRQLAVLPLPPIPKGLIPVAMCGVDLLGADLMPLRGFSEQCPLLCYATPLCDGVTWTNHLGGTCWLKLVNQYAFIGATMPKAGAISFVLLPAPLDVAVRTLPGVDFPGNDLMNRPTAVAGACEAFCLGNAQCFAWTWTDFNGGTCWLKRQATTFVPKAGARSGYLVRSAPGGLVSRACK